MVRCLPGEDATNGFFVSCFVRSTLDGHRVNDRRKRKRMMEDKEEDSDKEKGDEEGDQGVEPVATESRKKKKKIKKKKNVKVKERHYFIHIRFAHSL